MARPSPIYERRSYFVQKKISTHYILGLFVFYLSICACFNINIMAASHNPNHDNIFEPFLAVAVTKYISDEDHILSFKVGQEMLITGEVIREAGQFWWKGKVDSSEEEDKFIHKASVVKKIPYLDQTNEQSRNREEEELKLQNLLRSVNLDVDKWTRILKIEQIRSVEDLEAVLLEDGEDSDLAKEMKSSERIKFRTIKETGEEKANLKKWILNAGLDYKMWLGIMARYGVNSVADLVAVSNINSTKIIKAARNSREEAAVQRLLQLDLSGGAGGMTKCLKGCGMKLPVENLGGHNCLEMLRTRLETLTEFVGPLVPFAKITELTPGNNGRFRPWHMLTDNTAEYWQEHGMSNYWSARNGHKGPTFLYELSSAAHIVGFSLRNTANAHHNDKGTNEYKLLASLDGQDFWEVYSGSLPDVRNKFATTPCVQVNLEQPVLAKYIRFDVVSFYGVAPGLHYFKAHCDLTC